MKLLSLLSVLTLISLNAGDFRTNIFNQLKERDKRVHDVCETLPLNSYHAVTTNVSHEQEPQHQEEITEIQASFYDRLRDYNESVEPRRNSSPLITPEMKKYIVGAAALAATGMVSLLLKGGKVVVVNNAPMLTQPVEVLEQAWEAYLKTRGY